VREAEKFAGLGCKYYKMKIHDPDPKVNRARVEAVGRALGPGVRLMVDVNQRLDVLGLDAKRGGSGDPFSGEQRREPLQQGAVARATAANKDFARLGAL